MEPGDRIAQLMREKKISNAEMARRINVSRPTIGNWISGFSKPTGENLTALAAELDSTPDYIMTGKGGNLSQINFWDDETPLENDEFEVPFFKDFLVSCGNGSTGEALATETRKLRMSKSTARNLGVDQSASAAVTATGNSMSPKINDGDTVFIDTSKTRIKDGKIFAVCHGGVFRFKVLYQLPFGGVRIVSVNADEYPEERLTSEELEKQQFEVLGQVWSISSTIPL